MSKKAGRPRKIDIVEVKRLHDDGLNLYSIASYLDVSYTAIYARWRNTYPDTPHHGDQAAKALRLPNERLKELHDAGHNLPAISRMTGVPITTVRKQWYDAFPDTPHRGSRVAKNNNL